MPRRVLKRRSRRRRRRARTFIRKGYFLGNASGMSMLARKSGRGSLMVHSYKRYGGAVTISGNVAYAPYLSTLAPAFNAVRNVSDFSSLYDQYRITKVVFRLWLRIDPSAQTAGAASYPKLYYFRDLDDTGLPSNLDEMRERSNLKIKVFNPNRPITITVRPNLLNTLYSSAVASNYEPVWGRWVDMTLTNTQYYGVKIAIDDLTNTNYKVDIEQIYYFQCRSPR